MEPWVFQLIGWMSQICFACCGLPLAYRALKYKVIHLDLVYLCCWTAGESLGIIYIIHLGEWPLIFNYCLNGAMLFIIWYYRQPYPKEISHAVSEPNDSTPP